MSEVPNNWSVKTPSLSGRRAPWGAPKPVLFLAVFIAIGVFFYLRSTVGSMLAIPLGIGTFMVPVIFAARATRKDRDWFYLILEMVILRVRYWRYLFWRWRYDF